ncbi:MAG: TSUP family transporter [Campylobacteraceae bacterium]|jgi:uncharacterized membrane protein YfcA|nr:TSUP family transporter [Campylobacteraceae bacterium]
MELELWSFLVVCPLIFLAGFVDAIAGGGGLISLPAYIFAGLPVHFAIGTNKLSSTIGTLVAALRYHKNGFTNMSLCIPSIFAALVGSAIGAMLANGTDERVLQKILLVLLPLIALYMFKNKSLEADFGSISYKKTVIYSCLVSFGVGMYDGFFGPGTGTFLIILYITLARIDPRIAAGNAKMVNLSSNISALVIFIYNGHVSFALGLCAGAFSVLGSYMGAGLAIKKGSNVIRVAIIFVLVLLFLKLGYDLI